MLGLFASKLAPTGGRHAHQGLKALMGVSDQRALLDECLRGCVGGQYELLLDRQAQLRALLAAGTGDRQH